MMKLYDELITELLQMPGLQEGKKLPLDFSWPVDSETTMVLRSDMAYELGGERLPSLGLTLSTMQENLVSEDGVSLIGPDLPDISSRTNVPYARIALVRLAEGTMASGEALYNAIRKLEYTRYHFFPRGFMQRVSSSKNKECVRVSRKALEEGLTFSKAGSLLIKAFHENPKVEAVQVIYITDPAIDFGKLSVYAKAGEDITLAIDHIFKNVTMDCNVCELQPVCDEVEGLRELHFSQQA